MENKLDKFITFMKKAPLLRVLCIALVLTTAVSVTFAKYLSTTNPTLPVGVSPFAANITVDRTKELQVFNNAPYVTSGVIMNSHAITPFTVRNYEQLDADNARITEVDLDYNLVFYIPAKTFASSAAIQLTEKNKNGEVVAVTPLYELRDFFTRTENDPDGDSKNNTNDNIEITLKTDGSVTTNSTQYEAIRPTAEETLTYNAETRAWEARDGENLVSSLKFELETLQSTEIYTFTAKASNADLLIPALKYTVEKEDLFLKITLTRPDFRLAGGDKTERDFELRLIPIFAMSGLDYEYRLEWKKDVLSKFDTTTALAAKLRPAITTGWNIEVTEGDENVKFKVNFIKTKKNEYGQTVVEEEYPDVFIGDDFTSESGKEHGENNGKSYPCRINAIFTQASDIPEENA